MEFITAGESHGPALTAIVTGVPAGVALEQADVMVFVTTSSFSAPAVEYARQFGIRLIDGAQLLSCCRQYNRPDEATADTGDMDCRLTRADLLAYYPPDMRQKNAR